jgi:PIN domain nuclease of toxin-antitoxin system
VWEMAIKRSLGKLTIADGWAGLVAQARVERLATVSADRRLGAYGVDVLW